MRSSNNIDMNARIDNTTHRPTVSVLLALLLLLAPLSYASAKTTVLFSPHGGIRDRIIREINRSKTSIDVAIYSFTSGEIAWALERARTRGVKIRIVMDYKQSRGRHSEHRFLVGKGFDVRLSQRRGRGLMHHKFAVFDGRRLFCGSYNWSENAESYNEENAIFSDEAWLAKAFLREFERIWANFKKGKL